MKLSDHYDPNYKPGGGGDYLPAGKHKVRVKAFMVGESKERKTPFVEFEFENQDGKAFEKFYITEKAIPRLASFAVACGMSESELASYDAEAANDHAKLVNRIVVIDWQLQKDSDKYHEVKDWERAGEATLVEIPTAAEANAIPDDDIPF